MRVHNTQFFSQNACTGNGKCKKCKRAAFLLRFLPKQYNKDYDYCCFSVRMLFQCSQSQSNVEFIGKYDTDAKNQFIIPPKMLAAFSEAAIIDRRRPLDALY